MASTFTRGTAAGVAAVLEPDALAVVIDGAPERDVVVTGAAAAEPEPELELELEVELEVELELEPGSNGRARNSSASAPCTSPNSNNVMAK